MVQERPGSELVPLSSAAATAYLTLAGGSGAARPQLTEGLRDVAAIALAAYIPIYGALQPDRPLRRLSAAELAGGSFVEGARRLQFRDGRPAFERLAVTSADFAQAVMCLKRAGVNFSQARPVFTPRRVAAIRG